MNLVPVYVRSSGKATKGLHALQQKGALPWPEPQDGPALHALLQAPQSKTLTKNTSLPLFLENDTLEPTIKNRNDNPAQSLFSAVREILQEILIVPMSDVSIANTLNISQAQTQTWLQRLVDEGTLTHDQGTSSYGLYSKKSPAIESGL